MDDANTLAAAVVARLSGRADHSFETAVAWLELSGRHLVARKTAGQSGPETGADDVLGNLSDEERTALRDAIDAFLAEQAEAAA